MHDTQYVHSSTYSITTVTSQNLNLVTDIVVTYLIAAIKEPVFV